MVTGISVGSAIGAEPSNLHRISKGRSRSPRDLTRTSNGVGKHMKIEETLRRWSRGVALALMCFALAHSSLAQETPATQPAGDVAKPAAEVDKHALAEQAKAAK